MKADYKNWVPNGMIGGFGAATAVLAAGAAGVAMFGNGMGITKKNLVSTVLGAGALGCGAFTAWCV